MSESPVSRGKFLHALGKSVTGMALGTGVATAAQTLAGRIAAVSEGTPASVPTKNEAVDPVRFIESGPTDGNRIAITFDDGPTPGVTNMILDELRKRNLSATFFMIGQQVVAAPDLARRVLTEGHEVGNHTFTHPRLNTLPDPQVDSEIEKTQQVFRDLLNYQAAWFRPPYLALRRNQARIPQSKGLGIVLMNLDSSDWAQPGETKIVDTILSQTKPGAIILCHDMYPQTANCIGQILDGLLEHNFTFVTLSILLGQPSPQQIA